MKKIILYILIGLFFGYVFGYALGYNGAIKNARLIDVNEKSYKIDYSLTLDNGKKSNNIHVYDF